MPMMIRNRIFIAILSLLAVQNSVRAQEDTPLLDELIIKGIFIPETNSYLKLPAPTMRSGMTEAEQRKAIAVLEGDDNIDLLIENSVNSPMRFKIEQVLDLPNQGHIQQVDLSFIAYGKISDIEDKKLFEELAMPSKKKIFKGLPEEVRELTQDEIKSRNLVIGKKPDGSQVSYGVLKTIVLEKVYVTGITYSQGFRGTDFLTIAFRLEPKLKDDKLFPTQWSSLKEGPDGSALRDEPQPFTVAAAYSKVTKLAIEGEPLFIEIHFVYAEPFGWFDGRNQLRPKLPPLLQESVRSFRRKLKQ